MFSEPLFVQSNKIQDNAQIIFVSDMFAEDYVGGAELTTQALINTSQFIIHKIHSNELSLEHLKQGINKFWVFGNFANINSQLIPSIIGNLHYSVLEYDYKYCKYRSPKRHFHLENALCDCHNQINGKLISAFYYGAKCMWWMSEKQKEHYTKIFPFLLEKDNIVLSSVFDYQTLGMIKALRNSIKERDNSWIVLGSGSWVKGADAAKEWCNTNGKKYEVLWNVPYDQLLARLASAEGFVYLPVGEDTCPRMCIEAKLLGCKLVFNDNVQHKDEEWFDTDDIVNIEEYLYAAPKLFWGGIKSMMEYKPTISGYVTTYNCIEQTYPINKCITSMLNFCDEVCIVDGGSKDDTITHLASWAYPGIKLSAAMDLDIVMCGLTKEIFEFPDEWQGFKRDPRIKVKIINRDWNSKQSAVFDGMQKAEARAMCTKDFCWQMDSDEMVHKDDVQKIIEMCMGFPKGIDIISLPVIEYWGSSEKVRCDITPWKWRLSRNRPHITHGIPKELRTVIDDITYSKLGSDGCDMINKDTGERLPHVSFYTQEVDNVRNAALHGDKNALTQYESWFNTVVESLPSVFHFSWWDIPRKIKLYRDFWTRHWVTLTGKEYIDTPESNMMFDVSWSNITDEMIKSRAEEFKQIGGWIFHSKWHGEKTPWITVTRSHPEL